MDDRFVLTTEDGRLDELLEEERKAHNGHRLSFATSDEIASLSAGVPPWKSGDPSCGINGIGALQVLGAGIVKDIGALQVFGAGIEASADGEAISSLVAKLKR